MVGEGERLSSMPARGHSSQLCVFVILLFLNCYNINIISVVIVLLRRHPEVLYEIDETLKIH